MLPPYIYRPSIDNEKYHLVAEFEKMGVKWRESPWNGNKLLTMTRTPRGLRHSHVPLYTLSSEQTGGAVTLSCATVTGKGGAAMAPRTRHLPLWTHTKTGRGRELSERSSERLEGRIRKVWGDRSGRRLLLLLLYNMTGVSTRICREKKGWESVVEKGHMHKVRC